MCASKRTASLYYIIYTPSFCELIPLGFPFDLRNAHRFAEQTVLARRLPRVGPISKFPPLIRLIFMEVTGKHVACIGMCHGLDPQRTTARRDPEKQ